MDAIAAGLADFGSALQYSDLTPAAVHAAKGRLVDALGCGLGGFDSEPAAIARRLARGRSARTAARVVGTRTRSTPEAATFANTVMVRYLDANDQYQGARGSGHPSDALGAVLAAADMVRAGCQDVITATVVAYEVFAALAEHVPLRDRGWDQGVFVAPAVAVAAGRLLGLRRDQMAEAVSIAATAYVATRQTRAGDLSMWKGCATAAAAQGALWAAVLASEGMTGPTAPYEGQHGLFEQVTGPFALGPMGAAAGSFAVERGNYKYFPAEFHAQAPLEVMLALRQRVAINLIAAINVRTYAMAYGEIGSGAAKWDPRTRETADHSLPYMLAVALQDGELTPQSFTMERILDPALRPLMAKIHISEAPEFSSRYPQELVTEIELVTATGQRYVERTAYPKGHHRNPMTDDDLSTKFRSFARPLLGDDGCDRALAALWRLEEQGPIGPVLDLLDTGRT